MNATTIGYTISSDEIIRASKAQREQEERERGMFEDIGDDRAAQARKPAVKTAGRFSYDPTTGTVSGPAAYMAERYEARMKVINAGQDIVANMGIAQHGDTVLAVLVSLQTDYAAWAGMREFNTARR